MPMLMPLPITMVITDGPIDTVTHITDIHTIMVMDIMDIGGAREVPKNQKLEDSGEVRMPHPHQVPHPDRMPHLMLKPIQHPCITDITESILQSYITE